MKYTIKRNNKEITTVSPTGTLSHSIMAEEIVQMQFSLPKYTKFSIGDTVEVYGTTYVLNQEPNIQKISTIQYVYQLQFESFKYDLNKILYLGLNSANELTEFDFSIMGNPMMFLKHLVQNANRLGGNWKVGFADELEPKNISFSNHNVLSALSQIAQEFETEYWIDGNKTIHLIKRQNVSGLKLQYGQNNGLKAISRKILSTTNVVTRLYASGSTNNIPPKYRYGSERLKMNIPFLEKNIDKFGVIEYSKQWDDIYPRRNGKVTEVFADNPFRFVDSSMDFDLNGTTEIYGEKTQILLPGISAKVTFNTGQLSGYTFEIQKGGYNHKTKSFVLLKNKDEKAYEVPNSLLRPAVGDEYVLTDIIMPEIYIVNAETELKSKAQEYLDQNSIPRLQYSIQSDPIYFQNQNINIQLGNTVKFVDTDFDLDAEIRVVSISKDLQNPYQVEFAIAEEIQQAKIVRDYIDKNKKEQEIRETLKRFSQDTQRNYEFSQEIQENVFDAEGYFDTQKIKPLSIETKMLSVGAREQQFTLEDLTFIIEGNNTTLRNTKGQIVHYSLEDKPRTWNIPANTLNGISTGFNFIYIKAQKTGNNASVFVSPNQIKVDVDDAFYHFEAGYLSSIIEGFRKIRLSNGFTTINGREITTGRISSLDGKTFIDLDSGEISGRVSFVDGSPALETIDNKVKEGVDSVKVGGTNLIYNSKQKVADGIFAIPNSTQHLPQLFKKGDVFINSCYVEYENAQLVSQDRVGWEFSYTNTSGETKYVGCWKYNVVSSKTFKGMVSQKWTAPEDGSFIKSINNVNLYAGFVKGTKPTIVENPKMERGNIATDWSPNPQDVLNSIDNIQIGSRNYLIESNNIKMSLSDRPTTNDVSNKQPNGSFRITSTGVGGLMSRYHWLQNPNTGIKDYTTNKELVKGGSNLILSLMVRSNSDKFKIQFDVRDPRYSSVAKSIGKSDDFVKIEMVLPSNFNTARTNMIIYVNSDIQIPKDEWMEYKDLKLEIGTKSTDWTPAPEDIETQIADQEVYVEYSVDGVNNWHFPFQSNDRFMRQKKGNGVWSGAMPFGKDGMNGTNGTNGKYTVWQFAKNTSATTAPTTGWQNTLPTVSANEFVWTRSGEVTPPATTPTVWNTPIRQSGTNGTDGTNGKDGKYTVWQYAKNTSLTTAPTTGWQDLPPTASTNEFVWVRSGEVTPPATTPSTWNTPVRQSGENGASGKDGKYTVWQFSKNTSATTAPTTGWQNTLPTASANEFVWTRNGEVTPPATAPTVWNTPIRQSGTNGTDGTNGKDGKYTVWQFAKNTSLTTAPTTGWQDTPPTASANEFVWLRSGEVTPPATVPSTWNTPVRQSGENGANGKDGKYTVWQFAKNTSATTAPTTGWQDLPPTASTNEFIWMRSGEVTPPATTPSTWKTPIRQSGEKGDKGDVGTDVSNGKMLYNDPTFKVGMNSSTVYTGAGTLTRIAKPTEAPTNSTHILRVQNKGKVGTETILGGYYQNTNSRQQARFIHKIIANIPKGYTINNYNNAVGTGAKFTWFTSQEGTGKYEVYMYQVECGTSGTFSTFGHVAFNGSVYGTATNPIDFDIAFSTMYDMTDYDESAKLALEKANIVEQEQINMKKTQDELEKLTNFMTTEISGGVVTTGTLEVGSTVKVNGELKSQAKGGITGMASATNPNDRVIFYGGKGFSERENADFQVWESGKVVMNDAKVKGHIEATSGTFDNVTATNFNLGSGNVGALDIENNRLYYNYSSSTAQNYGKFYIIQMDFENNSTARIGKIGSLSNSITAMGAFHNKKTSSNDRNIGIEVHASGSKINNAININGGDISGFSLYTKIVTSTKYDITDESVIICKSPSQLNINLPNGINVWNGRTVTIKRFNRVQIVVETKDGSNIGLDSGYISSYTTLNGIAHATMFTYLDGMWYILTNSSL